MLRQHMRMIQIDRRVRARARGIDIDHLQVFTHRARLQVVLPSDLHHRFVDSQRFQAQAQRGVEGIHPKRAFRG